MQYPLGPKLKALGRWPRRRGWPLFISVLLSCGGQWLEQGSLSQRYGPGTLIHQDLVAYLLYRNQSMGWNDTMSGICFKIIWEGEASEIQVKHNWLELVRVEAGWWSSYSTYFMLDTLQLKKKTELKNIKWGTSLVVQWLRICLAMQGMQVQSLVRELRFHMPQSN